MFQPSSKKVLLSVLVATFVVQTSLVYSDDVDLVLTDDAVAGRKLFHDGSCQVCHQLWGQGGFLGPDLTNAASRVDQTRLASLLTVGSGQMPAYGYDDGQIAEIRAFLVEIDRPELGRGQLRLGDPGEGSTSPQAAFAAAVTSSAPPEGALRGFETFNAGICSACHFPFQRSVVGAPDLTTVAERLDPSELRTVLTEGRPLLGMPPPVPALTDAQIDELIAFFQWSNEERSSLRAASDRQRASRRVDWSRLPWWEFR